jgi:hypothetical protein
MPSREASSHASGQPPSVTLQRDIRSAVGRYGQRLAQDVWQSVAIHPFPAGVGTTFRISVSLSPQEYAGLRSLAASSQRSLGWVMRLALDDLLNRQSGQLELPFISNLRTGTTGAEGLQKALERLSKIDWRDIKRRTSGTIHNFHPYPTRFTPEIPGTLIELFSAPGETILDPFCGSGTTLVEAIRQGRRGVGVDVSPLATLICRAKTTRLSAQDDQAIQAAVAHACTLIDTRRRFSNDPTDPNFLISLVKNEIRKAKALRTLP